ncbi:hypothetical protein [Stutzerimonas kunmingensis]|jgi:hypothetical protein|uniref:hypothetical protein n=1 Tax=Stutzerimonas kunmingensis TaxID=1211807 RepID=UPI00256325A8|nr:hypothetical protein [Stutzerimonas kunmingensis]WOF76889.1 hypothetical protein P5704_012430 [Pseudomonas sp. FeN3W]
MQKNKLSLAIAELHENANASKVVFSSEIQRIVSLLFYFAEAVVENYKASRRLDQESNPNFRFWTHICSIEQGVTAVTIRWRKYSGKSKFSTPIDTTELVDFKLPARAFKKCTKSEKKAILEAERNFGIVRKISSHLARTLESMRAIQDITNISLDSPPQPMDPEEKRILDALEHLDRISQEHAELDRAAVRRMLGL